MIWNIEAFNGYNKLNMLKINTKKRVIEGISTIHTRLGVAIAFSMCPPFIYTNYPLDFRVFWEIWPEAVKMFIDVTLFT